MAEIVNLRRARKRLQRAADADAAAQNRARHGRTPAQRASDMAEAARRNALLDGARQDDDGDADQVERAPERPEQGRP